jgi:hypothetical protein
LFSGGYEFFTLLNKNIGYNGAIKFKGIFSIFVITLVPIVKSIAGDVGRGKVENDKIHNKYLIQESSFEKILEESIFSIKNKVNEMMKEMVFEMSYFDHLENEKDYDVYRSEKMGSELSTKNKQRNKRVNKYIVNFDYREIEINKTGIIVKVNRENQYIELSNKGNEELVNRIYIEMDNTKNKGIE